jgi:hypothetical protein
VNAPGGNNHGARAATLRMVIRLLDEVVDELADMHDDPRAVEIVMSARELRIKALHLLVAIDTGGGR